MVTTTRAADERGIILAAPLTYAALVWVVQCLTLAPGTRGEAETLRTKVWPYMDAAGVADRLSLGGVRSVAGLTPALT